MASYRIQLQTELARLLREIDELSKTKDFGSDVDGEDEEADEAEEIANRLAAAQTLKNRVNEIEEALRRMDAGTYGKCAECGAEISKEVLDLAPESTLCADCKKKAS